MFNTKLAVITGGSSGLGLAIAMSLSQKGTRLVLIARNIDKLQEARETICREHPESTVDIFSCDVSDTEKLDSCFQEIEQTLGVPDFLINSAGILKEDYFEKLEIDDFRHAMEINYFGTLNAIKTALPYLKRSKGHIVNIASVAGLQGVFGYSAYCSTKYALVGLTETLWYELQPQGIKVHLVCPAEFDSPMVDALNQDRSPENIAHAQMIPKYNVETIAKQTLAGIERGRFMILPGRVTKLLVAASRIFPTLSRMIVRLKIRLTYKA